MLRKVQMCFILDKIFTVKYMASIIWVVMIPMPFELIPIIKSPMTIAFSYLLALALRFTIT